MCYFHKISLILKREVERVVGGVERVYRREWREERVGAEKSGEMVHERRRGR
jgi:hypothetical protein